MIAQQSINWIRYALDTGQLLDSGGASAPEAMAAAPAGSAYIVSRDFLVHLNHEERPEGMVLVQTVDIDAVRSSLYGAVDALAAQAGGIWRPIYTEKEAQARALIAGGSPDDAPIITAQAAITGQTVGDVAAAVVAAADAANARQMAIEAKRAGTKYRISQETNLARLAELTRVDFDAGAIAAEVSDA